MAPRWGGLRPEPYKLSPPDADSDMIVQEGTAWERPGGLRLLDRLGNAITAGMESLSPVDGLRYVDAGGKDVAYVPTWTGDDVPVPGTGLRTLSSMSGVRTVGEMTGGSASLKDRGLALGDRRKAIAKAVREAQKPKKPEKPEKVVVPELTSEDVLTPELTAALDELRTLSRELEELVPRTNADVDAGVVDEVFDRGKGKSITRVGKRRRRTKFGLEDEQFDEHEDAAIPALTERGQELIDKIDAVGEKIDALSADLIKERTSISDDVTAAMAEAEGKKEEARQAYYEVTRPLREDLAEQIIADVLEYFEGYGRTGPATRLRGRLEPGQVPGRNPLRRMLSGVPFSEEEDKQIFRERMIEGLGRLNVLAVDGVSGQRPLDGGTGSVPGGTEGMTRQVEELIKEALDDLVPDSHKEDLFSTDSRRRGLIAHLNDSSGGHRRIATYSGTDAGVTEQPLMDETRRTHEELTDMKPNDRLVAREVNRQIMKALRPDHGSGTFTVALDESFDDARRFNSEDRALVDEAIAVAAAHMPASWVAYLNRMDYKFVYSHRAVHRHPTAERSGEIGFGGRLVGPGAKGFNREERLLDGVRQIIHEIGHAMSDPTNGDNDIATGRGGRGNLRYVMAQAFVSSHLSKGQLTVDTEETKMAIAEIQDAVKTGAITSEEAVKRIQNLDRPSLPAQLIHLADLSEVYGVDEVVWMFDALLAEPEMSYVFKYYRGIESVDPDHRADPSPDGEVLAVGAEMIMAGTIKDEGPLAAALRAHTWASIMMGLDDHDPVPEGEMVRTVVPDVPELLDADGYKVSAEEFLRLALGTDHADGEVDGIPRLAFLAEYQGGNYDKWLIEQIERDWDVTGLTKEHIDQLIVDMRKNARENLPEKITVYRADDGDVVGRIDRAELGPVSVTQSREEASEYGEVVEFEIPREAVEFVNPETGEYVVDPAFLKKRNNNFKDAELNNGTT